MRCKKCYYAKLCDRAGVSFKADGKGGCAREAYYSANTDKSFTQTYSNRDAYYYYTPKETYDPANVGDEDAQDKSQAKWHDIEPPYDDESEVEA